MARKAKKADPGEHIIDRALAAAARSGWRGLALRDIAAAAEVSLDELYAHYPSKGAILAAYARRIDRAVLAAGPAEGDSARDRLFDVVMRRFEAMAPDKAGVAAILYASGREPARALCRLPRLGRSMAWSLEAAGLGAQGCLGAVRVAALGGIYLNALRTWLGDDDPDLARTMRALDTGLARAERAANLCQGWGSRRRSGADEAAAEAAG